MELTHPLRPICAQWLAKIKLAWDFKRDEFGKVAQECMDFFSGPHSFMYKSNYMKKSLGLSSNDPREPSWMMTLNRVAELVQLFGPVLYERNPIRKCEAKKPPVPPVELFGDPHDPTILQPPSPMNPMGLTMGQIVQQQFATVSKQVEQSRSRNVATAGLMEYYLNYTPNELGLKDESRRAIDEALITGVGFLETQTYQPPGSSIRLSGSFYVPQTNVIFDPDLGSMDHAKWMAIRCIHPVWEVEDEYGLPRGSIRATAESVSQQANNSNRDPNELTWNRVNGFTNDLLVYWKLYSKMGVGGDLAGQNDKGLTQTLGQFGKYAYLVLVEGVPYPLNMPPQAMAQAVPGQEQDLLSKLDWPIPFWADDAWPVTPILFHEVPGQLWPMAHIKPALGELKFLNWAYSFLMGKLSVTCRDFVAIHKSASEELKTAILEGKDLSLIEIDRQHGTIQEVVQWLQHPNINGDVWKVIEAIEQNFERRVGLTELVYGESARQMRSASEAELKSNQMNVRPDDMADKVEQAMTLVARKEAIVAARLLNAQDVTPILGPVGAYYWDQLITQSPFEMVFRELEYRIESGSARKPNKDRDIANMNQSMQMLFQPLFQYGMQTGDLGPVNNLMADWAKANDIDPARYVMKAPPAPMQPAQPMPGGGPKPPGAGAGAPPNGTPKPQGAAA